MAKFGLIGKNIDHSFSKEFFSQKFNSEQLDHSYHNFDIEDLDDLSVIIKNNSNLGGLNVTIPYKEQVISLLDTIEPEAKIIGAVNTIKIEKDGSLIGYNTDHYGFAEALAQYFPLPSKTALILGTGGASKAIEYVLKAMDFNFKLVSRSENKGDLNYEDIDENIMIDHCLIVNCTPIGMYPNIDEYPNIPYQFVTKDHFLFDLIYNPSETEFLKLGFAQGAKISNGRKMLEFQANRAWKIWNS